MIRWNKWTRDYTYTYEWHDGVWRLIHKKSNRPIVHWFKSWYSTIISTVIYTSQCSRLLHFQLIMRQDKRRYSALASSSKLQTPKSYPQDIHMLFTGRAPGAHPNSSLKLLEFPWFEDLDVLLPGKHRLMLRFGHKKRANKSPFYRPNRSLDY